MSTTDNAHRIVAKIGLVGIEKELVGMLNHGDGGKLRSVWAEVNGCDILDAYAVGIILYGGRP